MAITREQVNREYPFDADNMTQDDYDDLAEAMAKEDKQEIQRITTETFLDQHRDTGSGNRVMDDGLN